MNHQPSIVRVQRQEDHLCAFITTERNEPEPGALVCSIYVGKLDKDSDHYNHIIEVFNETIKHAALQYLAENTRLPDKFMVDIEEIPESEVH